MAEAHLALAPLRQRPSQSICLTRVPLVSAVIVNYRRWADTAALVDQLLGEGSLLRDQLEIIVVDNASAEHPQADVLARRPGVQVLQNGTNLGFAAAVNRGFAHSRGQWLLVLNPDLVLGPGFADALALAARELPSESCEGRPIGILGFELRNRDGTLQHSVGEFPSFGKMLTGLLRPRRRRKYLAMEGDLRRLVPWVTGCCLLVRRKCLEQLGGFDEDFFLYYEDVDLCRRAAELGWAVCFEPGVHAVHLDPLQNRKPVPGPLWAITRHAALTYFRKHHPGWQSRGLVDIVRIEAWVREKLAMLRGRSEGAVLCRHLLAICRELKCDRPALARSRLDSILQRASL
jgi:GT2 family glycosyltransferase